MLNNKLHRKKNLIDQETERIDAGFGANVTSKKVNLIKADGQFNIKRKGQSISAWLNSYHRLITMRNIYFFPLIFITYLFVNLLFALVYYWIGTEHIIGINETEILSPFWNAFFFSSQTLTTVGYGHLSPAGSLTNIVASLEALLGLMMFALITGLIYGRFSRPNPKILFSDNCLVAPYLNINGLMFQMVNEKSNQLINITVSVMLSRNETDDNGKISRKYYNLKLERSHVKFFPSNWTIVHPITDESPFYNQNQQDIIESDTELLISIEGLDDTYSDLIHVRKSYSFSKIKWGEKYSPIVFQEGNKYIVDLNKLNKTMPYPLN